jgi:hypothetical protein
MQLRYQFAQAFESSVAAGVGATPMIFFCGAGGRNWPIASFSQFGPCPQVVEPDIAE